MPRRNANARRHPRRRDEAVVVLRPRRAYTPPGWGAGWRRYRLSRRSLTRIGTVLTLPAVLAIWAAVMVALWRWS